MVLSEAQPVARNSSTIVGTITGGHYPQQEGEDSWATFVSPQARGMTRIDGSNAAGVFSLPVEWAGATSVEGRLHALQLTWQGELPGSFTSHGSAPLTLSPGGESTPTIA